MSLLRQIEVAAANGTTRPPACRENGIREQTYCRWRKQFGGLQVDHVPWLRVGCGWIVAHIQNNLSAVVDTTDVGHATLAGQEGICVK